MWPKYPTEWNINRNHITPELWNNNLWAIKFTSKFTDCHMMLNASLTQHPSIKCSFAVELQQKITCLLILFITANPNKHWYNHLAAITAKIKAALSFCGLTQRIRGLRNNQKNGVKKLFDGILTVTDARLCIRWVPLQSVCSRFDMCHTGALSSCVHSN